MVARKVDLDAVLAAADPLLELREVTVLAVEDQQIACQTLRARRSDFGTELQRDVILDGGLRVQQVWYQYRPPGPLLPASLRVEEAWLTGPGDDGLPLAGCGVQGDLRAGPATDALGQGLDVGPSRWFVDPGACAAALGAGQAVATDLSSCTAGVVAPSAADRSRAAWQALMARGGTGYRLVPDEPSGMRPDDIRCEPVAFTAGAPAAGDLSAAMAWGGRLGIVEVRWWVGAASAWVVGPRCHTDNPIAFASDRVQLGAGWLFPSAAACEAQVDLSIRAAALLPAATSAWGPGAQGFLMTRGALDDPDCVSPSP